MASAVLVRAQVEAGEPPPGPQGAPNVERGSAAGTDLERAGGSGGREGAARVSSAVLVRAQVEAGEPPPGPQGVPNVERGSAAGTDLERAGGSGGREALSPSK